MLQSDYRTHHDRLIRGILHDEEQFPDPLTFKPDRWCSSSTPNSQEHQRQSEEAITPLDPFNVAFGYGRRICPGVAVARQGLWIFMATILSTFEIRQKEDPQTLQSIKPDAKWAGNDMGM